MKVGPPGAAGPRFMCWAQKSALPTALPAVLDCPHQGPRASFRVPPVRLNSAGDSAFS